MTVNVLNLDSVIDTPSQFGLHLRVTDPGRIEDRAIPVVVAVIGELDVYTYSEMAQCLNTAFDTLRLKMVILDLSECVYADSTGIGALLAFTRQARGKGASLVLAQLTPRMRHLLSLTHLDCYLQIAPTLDEAYRLAGDSPFEDER